MPNVSPTRPGARGGHRAEALILGMIFCLANVAGAIWQPQITKDGGKGWEGIDYHALAEGFARGEVPVTADAPTVYRVGTPALVALVHHAGWAGSDMFTAFRVVNLLANALSLWLLMLWLRRFVGDWRIRTALGTAWLLQWDTPTRWLWFYPAHTDPWMWVFLLAGLLVLDDYRQRPTRGRLLALTALGVVGVLFREVVAVVPLALLFVEDPWRRDAGNGRRRWHWPRPILAVPLLATLTGIFALHNVGLVRAGNDFSFAHTAWHWLHAKRPWVYAHGWLAAFGPGVLALVLVGWREARAFLAGRQDLAVFLVAMAFLGQIGGTDTERLVYWTMPVVFVLAGRTLETHRRAIFGSPALVLALVGVQLVASRAVFWPIPDYPGNPGGSTTALPLLTPLGARVPYLDLFSFFAERRVQLLLLTSNLLVLGLVSGWLRRRQVRDHVRKTFQPGV